MGRLSYDQPPPVIGRPPSVHGTADECTAALRMTTGGERGSARNCRVNRYNMHWNRFDQGSHIIGVSKSSENGGASCWASLVNSLFRETINWWEDCYANCPVYISRAMHGILVGPFPPSCDIPWVCGKRGEIVLVGLQIADNRSPPQGSMNSSILWPKPRPNTR